MSLRICSNAAPSSSTLSSMPRQTMVRSVSSVTSPSARISTSTPACPSAMLAVRAMLMRWLKKCTNRPGCIYGLSSLATDHDSFLPRRSRNNLKTYSSPAGVVVHCLMSCRMPLPLDMAVHNKKTLTKCTLSLSKRLSSTSTRASHRDVRGSTSSFLVIPASRPALRAAVALITAGPRLASTWPRKLDGSGAGMASSSSKNWTRRVPRLRYLLTVCGCTCRMGRC